MSIGQDLERIVDDLERGRSARDIATERMGSESATAMFQAARFGGDGDALSEQLVQAFGLPMRFWPDRLVSQMAKSPHAKFISTKARESVSDHSRWYWLVGMSLMALMGWFLLHRRDGEPAFVPQGVTPKPNASELGLYPVVFTGGVTGRSRGSLRL
jgi:hypothetical protein